ncbi:hypothetical protein ACEO74_002970 [Vibrio cholerae]|nr:hypothetical protein [Vibrio cholerae]EKF9738578.1 hypothetical protein [Vibrio cholerae]
MPVPELLDATAATATAAAVIPTAVAVTVPTAAAPAAPPPAAEVVAAVVVVEVLEVVAAASSVAATATPLNANIPNNTSAVFFIVFSMKDINYIDVCPFRLLTTNKAKDRHNFI